MAFLFAVQPPTSPKFSDSDSNVLKFLSVNQFICLPLCLSLCLSVLSAPPIPMYLAPYGCICHVSCNLTACRCISHIRYKFVPSWCIRHIKCTWHPAGVLAISSTPWHPVKTNHIKCIFAPSRCIRHKMHPFTCGCISKSATLHPVDAINKDGASWYQVVIEDTRYTLATSGSPAI